MTDEPRTRRRRNTGGLPDALALLDAAAEIVDVGEQRALAADGPVGHCRTELSDNEFDQLWKAVENARRIVRHYLKVAR